MTAAAIRALLAPGVVVRVTNHFITRADHPCFGTQDRTVARVTSGGLWFTVSGRVAWPKAAQLAYDAHARTITFYGGGIGQAPTDRFLTIAL